MGFMTTDYSENKEMSYEVLPTGTYEMVINKVQETATKNGAESLQLDLVVRNDLDGVSELADTNKQYHNRHVFNDNWKRKETGNYDMQGLQYILAAAGVPEGVQVATIDDFINLLHHKPVKVYLKKEKNEYKGKVSDVNRVAPWNYTVTAFQNNQHQFKDEDGKSEINQKKIITDADLPF